MGLFGGELQIWFRLVIFQYMCLYTSRFGEGSSCCSSPLRLTPFLRYFDHPFWTTRFGVACAVFSTTFFQTFWFWM
jgi:hypothetical protein